MRKVSLYIPCFNAEKTILPCLDAVLGLDYPLEEIVVVDDGSTDETVKIISGYPVRIISVTDNKGLAAARNAAIKTMKSEFIASLDADCIPEKTWLSKIMEVFNREDIAGAGGKLMESGDNILDIWRKEHLAQNWGDRKEDNPEFLFGSNTVFKKEVLSEVGLYNEIFRSNYEDCDISTRVKEKGYKLLYLPGALVYHIRNDTLPSLLNTFWRWNLHFYETQNAYADLKNFSLKIKDNMGLSNRFIEEDMRSGKVFLVYLDFLLSTSLIFKDLMYFSKLKNRPYNKKLVSFLYVLEQTISLKLGTEQFKPLLKNEYNAERYICLLVLFMGAFFKEKFSHKNFYKVWLGDILVFYFENTEVSAVLNMLINLIESYSYKQLEQLCSNKLVGASSIAGAIFIGNFDLFFDNFKLDRIIESSFKKNAAVCIKKYAEKTIDQQAESVLYLCNENIEWVEKDIKSLSINDIPANYEQFIKDCDYYYSRVLNYPLVKPAVIQFDFMRRCQLQCRICKIWSNRATELADELSLEELKDLFDQASDLGVTQCYFSGGEPFLLPYLFDILAYSKQKGMYTEVTTNGLLLTEDNRRRLIELPVNQLNVSIDGASAQTHDYHRNKPGLFNKVIDNLKALAKLKKAANPEYPIINMACILTNKNFFEMLDYVKLAREIGVNAFFQAYVSENDNYYYRSLNDEFVIPDKGESLVSVLKEIDRVIGYKQKYAKADIITNTAESLKNFKKLSSGCLKSKAYCFAGFNRIIILSGKKVNICPGEIGDLNKNSLKEIWFSEKAEQMRRKILNCSKPCLMGASYQPGPSINDIVRITKRYITNLKKHNKYNEESINNIITQLIKYTGELRKKGLYQEKEKLELILQFIKKSRRVKYCGSK